VTGIDAGEDDRVITRLLTTGLGTVRVPCRGTLTVAVPILRYGALYGVTVMATESMGATNAWSVPPMAKKMRSEPKVFEKTVKVCCNAPVELVKVIVVGSNVACVAERVT